MHYVVRERLGLGLSFHIENERGATVYQGHGPAVRLRQELKFEDAHGTELAWVKEPFLTDGLTYEVHRGGRRVARVKQLPDNESHCTGEIVMDHGPRLAVYGTLAAGAYTIRAAGVSDLAVVAGHGDDAYTVDTVPDQDDVLLLASTIAIYLMVSRPLTTSSTDQGERA